MSVDEVKKYFGGKMQSAIALGVSLQTIVNWENGGIPQVRQESIQLKTHNKLKADKL